MGCLSCKLLVANYPTNFGQWLLALTTKDTASDPEGPREALICASALPVVASCMVMLKKKVDRRKYTQLGVLAAVFV